MATARQWLGAFAEGGAMLAAAGGPEAHPHAARPAAGRARWDRDVGRAGDDLRRVEAFLLAILDRRFADLGAIRAAGMEFFGVQGPWSTAGRVMASTIERSAGRRALIEALCALSRSSAATTRRCARRARGRPAGPRECSRGSRRRSPAG